MSNNKSWIVSSIDGPAEICKVCSLKICWLILANWLVDEVQPLFHALPILIYSRLGYNIERRSWLDHAQQFDFMRSDCFLFPSFINSYVNGKVLHFQRQAIVKATPCNAHAMAGSVSGMGGNSGAVSGEPPFVEIYS